MAFGVVLFDLDHTLFDSDASLSAAYELSMRTARIGDPDTHRDDFERINDALWRAVERGEVSPNDVRWRRFDQLLRHLGRADEAADLAPRMADAFVAGLIEHGELLPGASALLDALDGRPVALVTNGIGAVQRGRLARLGLTERFDAVAVSGELEMAKPGRAIFDHTLELLGVQDRADVAMVGDNWGSDVTGALAADITPIWFNPAGGPRPDGPRDSTVIETRTLAEVGEIVLG